HSRFGLLSMRRQRQFRLGAAANKIGNAERPAPESDYFQMGHFPANIQAKPCDNFVKQIIERERPITGNVHAAIEPAHFGFAFGISVVVDVQNLPAEAAVLIEQSGQRLESLSRPRGEAKNWRSRI